MSEIADQVTPTSLVLLNESFAATNEREGAEIAQAIVLALLEAGMKVCFVTHSFELASRFHHQGMDSALFVRAERLADGTRTSSCSRASPCRRATERTCTRASSRWLSL